MDDDLKVIRIDTDPNAAGRLRPADASLVGDAAVYTSALVRALDSLSVRKSEWDEDIAGHRTSFERRFAELEPQKSFLAAIRRALPRDGIFVDEVTQMGFASRLAFPVYQPRTFLSAGYQDIWMGLWGRSWGASSKSR